MSVRVPVNTVPSAPVSVPVYASVLWLSDPETISKQGDEMVEVFADQLVGREDVEVVACF